MGFRFRKSFKAGPFRINVSKSGIGYSAGVKGFRVTKRADGRTQRTYSVPGTGISYVDTIGGKMQTPRKTRATAPSVRSVPQIKPVKSRGLFVTMRVLCVILALLSLVCAVVFPLALAGLVLAVWGWFAVRIYLPDEPEARTKDGD